MTIIDVLLKIYDVLKPVIDIGLLAFILYKGYGIVVRTNGMQLIRAALLTAIAYGLVAFMHLDTMLWIFNVIAPGLILGFVIVFQPEIRKILLKVGQAEWFKFGKKSKHTYADSVLIAADILSKQRRGMLAIFVRKTPLKEIIDSGTKINADLSSALIVTIFGHDTPLHDGAIVIQDGKLISAGCFLPLSENYDIKKTFGTRHRAALGVSETSDCVVVVVSEESGAISLAYDAQLHYDLTMEQLTKTLESLLDLKPEAKQIEDTIDEHKTLS